MTSGPHIHPIPHVAASPALRMRLKPTAPATGYVDGAWWPRSRDLTTELAALTDVLAARLGRIERVAYAQSSWDTAPRQVDISGDRVRLEGFSYQDRNIIHVTGSNDRITLLVVPPELADLIGHDALMTAGCRGNADRPEEILAAASLPALRLSSESSTERWESDGGHVGPGRRQPHPSVDGTT